MLRTSKEASSSRCSAEIPRAGADGMLSPSCYVSTISHVPAGMVSGCGQRRSPQRQLDGKRGPASRFTDDTKRAAQRLDDVTGDRKAQSHTAVLLARDGALEAPE